MFPPMPDEIAIGHGNRLAIFNGFEKYTRMQHILRAKFRLHLLTEERVSMLDQLAFASGVITPAYTMAHSMLPAIRVTSESSNKFIHGSLENSKLNIRLGMLIPRKFACVCSECIHEDMEQYGYSYYRRSHHINGIDWCSKHGEVLKRIISNCPFSKFPHDWQRKMMIDPLPTCNQHIDQTSEFVRRYSEISLAFLKQCKPNNVSLSNMKVAACAKALGLNPRKNGHQPLLSDHVIAMLPDNWLYGSAYEVINQKNYGEWYPWIDGILRSINYVARSECYALTLAALYDSAEAALADFGSMDLSRRQPSYMARKT